MGEQHTKVYRWLQDGSFKDPKCMFHLLGKKILQFCVRKCPYQDLPNCLLVNFGNFLRKCLAVCRNNVFLFVCHWMRYFVNSKYILDFCVDALCPSQQISCLPGLNQY